MCYCLEITSDSAVLVSNVNIDTNSDLAFAMAVFPLSIPADGKGSITVQVTEPREGGTGHRVLDEITRTILIEVGQTDHHKYRIDYNATLSSYFSCNNIQCLLLN